MKRKYRIVGMFCLYNRKDELIKETVFINKNVEADDGKTAKDIALEFMIKKYSERYKEPVELKQLSNIRVHRI